MVSTNCTIIRAEDTRDSRYTASERTWYQRTAIVTGMNATSRISPERQSRMKIETAVKSMNIMPETSEDTPWSSSSRSDSRSEVCREITRPEVYFSWNSRLSRWVCRNTHTRKSSSMAWLTRAVIQV